MSIKCIVGNLAAAIRTLIAERDSFKQACIDHNGRAYGLQRVLDDRIAERNAAEARITELEAEVRELEAVEPCRLCGLSGAEVKPDCPYIAIHRCLANERARAKTKGDSNG